MEWNVCHRTRLISAELIFFWRQTEQVFEGVCHASYWLLPPACHRFAVALVFSTSICLSFSYSGSVSAFWDLEPPWRDEHFLEIPQRTSVGLLVMIKEVQTAERSTLLFKHRQIHKMEACISIIYWILDKVLQTKEKGNKGGLFVILKTCWHSSGLVVAPLCKEWGHCKSCEQVAVCETQQFLVLFLLTAFLYDFCLLNECACSLNRNICTHHLPDSPNYSSLSRRSLSGHEAWKSYSSHCYYSVYVFILT